MMIFWIMVTSDSLRNNLMSGKRSLLPATPPIMTPMPNNEADLKLKLGSDLAWLAVDTIARVKTVILDKMLIVATSKSPRKSITGLMMTPI